MSIKVGVDGVVRDVSSVKLGVSGVTRDLKYGYNGVSGIRKQFFGQPTGIQYFMAVPNEIKYGISTSTATIPPDLTYLSSRDSAGYTIYQWQTSTVDDMYVIISLYQSTSRSYPRSYLADYVEYALRPTASVSVQRGFVQTWSLSAIYDNIDFTGLDKYEDNGSYTYYTNRASWMNQFTTTGKTPSVFTFDTSFYIYSNNSNGTFRYSYPVILGDSHNLTPWKNGDTKSITVDQSASGTTSGIKLGFWFDSSVSSTGSILSRFSFPSQSITLNGVSYPVYLSFAPCSH